MADSQSSRAPVSETPLQYPPGTLAHDPDEDRVRCHLCGRWYRALAPGHLLHRHGTDADTYRELAGLNPRHPLGVPSLSALRARQLRDRIRTDERVRTGMIHGAALARSGRLQARARAAAARRSLSIERERALRSSGQRLGKTRSTAYLERRSAAARARGFPDLAAYLRRRYLGDGARIADLQVELGASYTAIRGDLRRLGIPVRHGRPLRA